MSESLNDVEFDVPFAVSEDGSVTLRPLNVWGPEVFHSDENDVDVYSPTGLTWEPLTGWTGQYSYHGAVMHSSEFMGGALERHVLTNPGVYVMTVVEDDAGGEPVGWAVLRLRSESNEE